MNLNMHLNPLVPPPEPPRPRPGPAPNALDVAFLAVFIAGILVLAHLHTPNERDGNPAAAAHHTSKPRESRLRQVVRPAPLSPARLARLPRATTFGTVTIAPDRHPHSAPSGLLVHPRRTVAVYSRPGARRPAAALPTHQLGSSTWLPVIDQRPGWVRVLLPSRPNGATGWLYHHPGHTSHLDLARSSYRITVDLEARRLTLARDGKSVDSWTVAVGKPESPTPTGRTFLLASLRDETNGYSDLVLPLGAHSDTHHTYGGGPGAVGIHTWPDPTTFGHATSDGCIRVPPAALTRLRTVPLGTPVLIR